MERHLSYSLLVRVFSGHAAPPEADTVVAHLADCRPCWNLAVKVVAELSDKGASARRRRLPASHLANTRRG